MLHGLQFHEVSKSQTQLSDLRYRTYNTYNIEHICYWTSICFSPVVVSHWVISNSFSCEVCLLLQEVISQEPEGQRGYYFSFPTAQSHQIGPTQMANHKSHLSCISVLATINLEFLPPAPLIICQDGSQDSGKPVHLPDGQFIIKQYSSGTTRWKRRTGRDVWEGVEHPCPLWVHCPPPHPHVPQTRSSPNPLHQLVYGGFIM